MGKIIIVFLIFLFSIVLRIWNLNAVGRTWDEGAYIELGYPFFELTKKGDFNNSYWYSNPDHPPLARYFYGIFSIFSIKTYIGSKPVFFYDYTSSRLVSVVVASLSVVMVVILGWNFISLSVGVIAGIILTTLPIFLGFSQIATLESFIMFFFTASVYFFLRLLQKFSFKYVFFTGIAAGCALEVKQSNILLFPLFFLLYVLWYIYKKKELRMSFFNQMFFSLFTIGTIALLVFIVLWPMPWFHIKEVIAFHNHMWVSQVKLPPPEVFFGRLILVPKVYYIIYFFITTPVIVLIFFLKGLHEIKKQKNWILYSLAVWFLFPFIQSFYSFRQHGIRYIIEIYAPLSLIAALGFDTFILRHIKPTYHKVVFTLPIVLYFMVIIIKSSPYYLTYFNELMGGTYGVYTTKLFQYGYWGEGSKEAIEFIKQNTKSYVKVAMVLNQVPFAPTGGNIKFYPYTSTQHYDYVVVHYFSMLREGFDDTSIKQKYNLVHIVKAGDAPLVFIYKPKDLSNQ